MELDNDKREKEFIGVCTIKAMNSNKYIDKHYLYY
jgi:hypothetical protein